MAWPYSLLPRVSNDCKHSIPPAKVDGAVSQCGRQGTPHPWKPKWTGTFLAAYRVCPFKLGFVQLWQPYAPLGGEED